MPLPSPPKPSWFSPSRWFGAARPPAPAARSSAPLGADAQVEQLRTQARRRLIGAVVLLGAGLVAFPLVFETEPRPMGVDTPMQRVQGPVGRADGHAPTGVPSLADAPGPVPEATVADAAPAASPAATLPVAAPQAAVPPAEPAVATTAPVTPEPSAAQRLQEERESAQQRVQAQAQVQAAQVQREEAQRAEAQRARALLEGRSAAAPAATAATGTTATTAAPVAAVRYVVQVGAFTEPRALRDVRSRVERLGLKTYTQVISSPAGPRTRVRVGPFDSKVDADAAAAKLRAAGLPSAILSL